MYEMHVPLIVYLSYANCNEKMWKFVQTQSWYGQVEIFYMLDKFYQRFTKAGCSNAVTVLLLASRQELEELAADHFLICEPFENHNRFSLFWKDKNGCSNQI